MHRTLAAAAVAAATLAAPHLASACGVYPPGGAVHDVATSAAKQPESIFTPLIEAAYGGSENGKAEMISAGVGWGERDRGWFPGVVLTRVMVTSRWAGDHDPQLALTYGWYENQLLSAGFDFGVERTPDAGIGPTARLMMGVHGVGVQVAVGLDADGRGVHGTGSATLVMNVMDVVGAL